MLTKNYLAQQYMLETDPVRLAHLRIPYNRRLQLVNVPLAFNLNSPVTNIAMVRAAYPAPCKLDLPASVGGEQFTAEQMADYFMKAGYHDLDLRDAIGAGHGRMLTLVNSRRFDGLLRQIGEGKAYIGIAITEPQAGSNLYGVETEARAVGDRYVISGHKKFIGRIRECSHILLLAKVRRGEKDALSFFLVTREELEAHMVQHDYLDCPGLKGNSWSELRFEGLTLGAERLIGGEGCGISLFKKHFTYWRTCMAACAIGAAEKALHQAASYLNTRKVHNQTLGDLTHNQTKHGEYLARIWQCNLMVRACLRRIDRNDPEAYVLATMSKFSVIETCLEIVRWVKLIHGASGLLQDGTHDLVKTCNDLEALTIADGATSLLQCGTSKHYLRNQLKLF